MAGFQCEPVASDARGQHRPGALAAALDRDVAALMLTLPNTLGLFDRNILRIADMVHESGALIYCDGANLNALLGR